MTLREAAAMGIERVRLPHWADPGDYVKIDIVKDAAAHGWSPLGPWGHLYAPIQTVMNEPQPQDFLVFDSREAGYVPYEGPLLEPVGGVRPGGPRGDTKVQDDD